MFSKALRFVIVFCLIFLSGASIAFSGTDDGKLHPADPIFVENSHTDDFQLEKIILVPLKAENHFSTGIEPDSESIDLTETEDEEEVHETYSGKKRIQNSNYFIDSFGLSLTISFDANPKNPERALSLVTTLQRGILFQVFRI
jgi:hypothetical protein